MHGKMRIHFSSKMPRLRYGSSLLNMYNEIWNVRSDFKDCSTPNDERRPDGLNLSVYNDTNKYFFST